MMKAKPACLWQLGTMMDLDVLITDSHNVPNGWTSLTNPPDDNILAKDLPWKKGGGNILASWQQDGLILGGVSDGLDTCHAIRSFISVSDTDQEMNYRNTTLSIPLTPSI